MTTASGVKFGKTEAGAVWLDPERTSPFHFYQFWLNTDDRDVVRYLKFFTFLPRETIEALERATRESAGAREAQRALAREVTTLVHGADQVGARRARRVGAVRRATSTIARRGRCADGVRGCAVDRAGAADRRACRSSNCWRR